MPHYEAPASASPEHKVFSQFINAFDAFDLDGMLAVCDDEDFTFRLLPTALKVPQMNKAQVGPHMKASLLPAFDSMSVTVHEVIEAEGKIIAHAQSDSVSKQGTEWHNEYLFVFKFTPGPNPKISSWTEYVNSAFVAGFIAEETRKAKAGGGGVASL